MPILLTLKNLIEGNFSKVLLLAFALGIAVPQFALLPAWFIIALLSIVIFFNCSKVTAAELAEIHIKDVLFFYILRFLILPVVLFFLVKEFLPAYALGILLMSSSPAGVNAPTVTNIYRGNVFLSLGVVVLATFLTPILLPLLFGFLTTDITINGWGIFQTSAGMIFIPILLYWFGARRFESVKNQIRYHSRWGSIICLSLMTAIAAAKNRDVFLALDAELWFSLALVTCVYVVLYLVGWLFAQGQPYPKKLAIVFASGVNNNSLALGLALLYFPPAVATFAVMTYLPWTILIPLVGWLLERSKK